MHAVGWCAIPGVRCGSQNWRDASGTLEKPVRTAHVSLRRTAKPQTAIKVTTNNTLAGSRVLLEAKFSVKARSLFRLFGHPDGAGNRLQPTEYTFGYPYGLLNLNAREEYGLKSDLSETA